MFFCGPGRTRDRENAWFCGPGRSLKPETRGFVDLDVRWSVKTRGFVDPGVSGILSSGSFQLHAPRTNFNIDSIN